VAGFARESAAEVGQVTSAKRIADITAGHVLEQGVPLSRSRLWEFERAYYERQGLRAWGDGEVPYAITSNPTIAAGYAEVIVGFLRDCEAAGRLDRTRRVHVLELGSGSGRLGYGMLRHLRGLLADTSLRDQPVTVVLSDFDGAKLEQLAVHPRFAADLADGWLDFAVVDGAAPGEVRTWRRGEVVAGAPLVVVANYVFDSLPADVYSVGHGAVHEVGLTMFADAPDLDRHDPHALSRVRLTWKAADAPAPPTGNPAVDSVLARYAEVLDPTMVVVPSAALACLATFSKAAAAPTLALVADKGWSHLRDLPGQGPPVVVPDAGSFSMMVNFDAIARVVRAGGGTALLPPHRAQQLVVGAFVLGPLEATETARRYAELAEGGPDDIFSVRKSVAAGRPVTLPQALAQLRVARYDSQVFLELFPTLHDEAGRAEGSDRTDLALAVRRVRSAWFPIGERQDVSVCLGVLLSRIGHHREALELLAESAELRGANASAHLASAIAHHALRELDQALKDARDAVAIDPTNDAALRLAVELEAELGRDDGGAVLG
jgi:hypothetical protein